MPVGYLSGMVLRQHLFSHVRSNPNRLAAWLFDVRGITGEECPVQMQGKPWSLILFGIGLAFWLLRRISPREWLAHLLFEADSYDSETHRWTRGTPSAYGDLYSLMAFGFSLTLIFWFDVLLWPLLVVWAVLAVQETLYQAFWRYVVRIVPAVPVGKSIGPSLDGAIAMQQHVRLLGLAVLALAQITWLFTIIYYFQFGEDKQIEGSLVTLADAVYFSSGITGFFGVGKLQPTLDAVLLKYVIALHLASSGLILLAALSHGTAALATAREPYCDQG
jgi:hypothetical protein